MSLLERRICTGLDGVTIRSQSVIIRNHNAVIGFRGVIIRTYNVIIRYKNKKKLPVCSGIGS